MATQKTVSVPEDFFDFEEDKKWAGEYILKRLKPNEVLDIEKQCRDIDLMSGKIEHDSAKSSMMLLSASMVKPKKTIKELNEVPSPLIMYLIGEVTNLHYPSPKKRDFLLRASSTKSRQ